MRAAASQVDRASLAYVGPAAFVAAIWLLANPYFGIWHDSVLYTVQALYRQRPDIYGRDLYFLFGSQDQFSQFSLLYGQAIAALGIERAAVVLTVIGKLLWGAGLVYLLATYQRRRSLLLSLIALACFSPIYDGNGSFAYGESFLTGRLYSEALCLIGLGLVMRGRDLAGMAAVFVALLLHPLMALPGLMAVLLLGRWCGRPFLIVCLIGLTVVFALGLVGVEPFDRLQNCFDPVWLDIVEKRAPYLFLENWTLDAFGRMGLLAGVLVVCRSAFGGELVGRLAEKILLLGVACLILAWIGASVFHNVLITQIQVWRGIWILQIVAFSLLGTVSTRFWSSGRAIDRIFLIFLWSALLLKGISAGLLALAAACLWLLLNYFDSQWRPSRALWAAILLLPIISVVFAIGAIENNVFLQANLLARPAWQTVLCAPLVAIPLLMALTQLAERSFRLGALAAGALGLAAFFLSVMRWDGRPSWDRSWEDYTAEAASLQAIVPEGATVYWLGRWDPVWFWLQRAQYVSKMHSSVALFSRPAAMVLDYRQARLWSLNIDDGYPYWQLPYGISRASEHHPGISQANYLCQDGALDFVVFPANDELISVAHRFTYPIDASSRDLVDCARMRKRPPGVRK